MNERFCRNSFFLAAAAVLLFIEKASAQRLYVGLGHPNGRVDTYNLAGTRLNSFAPSTTFVSGIRTVPSGDVYVSSYGGLHRYTRDGTPILPPLVPTYSGTTLGMDFDASGALYVGLNGDPDSIFKFSPSGDPQGNFATAHLAGAPFDLEFDAAGNLYTTIGWTVGRFDPAGNWLGTFASLPVGDFVIDMEFDQLGNLFVSSFWSQSVYKFDQQGVLLGTIVSGKDSIQALAIAPNNVLYVGGNKNGNVIAGYVKKFLLDGTFVGDFLTNLDMEPVCLEFAVPEPGGLSLAFMALGSFRDLARRLRRRC
jgi:hypothetical protein